MLRTIGMVLWLAAVPPGGAAVLTEDFSADPATRGWRVAGDGSLFRWNASNQNVEATWDSSHSNSFYFIPLGTTLAKSDDFSFSFDLRLIDIRIGSTPGKSNEFELALGLLNSMNITNLKAFRGAGVSATYGVRNIIEFNYFPDAGFGDTFATTAISTNNVFAYAHNFPLSLSLGDTFHIALSYTAADQVLRTSATKNGQSFGPLADVSLVGKPDFRLDAFGITSYSDAVQTGSPVFYGSVLAHGVVDDVRLVVPPAPLGAVRLRQTNSVWLAEFSSRTNWLYTLEGSSNCAAWATAAPPAQGNGGLVQLVDTTAAGGRRFYRVRAERP